MSGMVVMRKSKVSSNGLANTPNFIINLFFWIYSAVCLLPVVLTIVVSFSEEKSIIINGYSLFPNVWSLDAYKFLFKDWDSISRSFGISIFQSIFGTIISLIMISLYAYPLSRKDLPYRNVFSFFIFFTMLFNGGLVPWYLVYTRLFVLKNTIWALIIPLLVPAFFVLMMRTFFSTSIPAEVIESARIDGAGELRIFAQIVLRLSLPVLATVALFQVIGYWNDWFLSLVFINDNKTINLQFLMYKTMLDIQFLTSNVNASQAISKQGGFANVPSETIRMAMAVLGIGPIIFAYPFFQQYYVKGLTIGSVKG